MGEQNAAPRTRREMKRAARAALKRHYAVYVFMVLVLVTIGGIETAGSQGLGIIRQIWSRDSSLALSRSHSAGDAFSRVLIGAAGEAGERMESGQDLRKREGSRGILSEAMNRFPSGDIMAWAVTALISMIGNPTPLNIRLLWLALFVYALVWIFILDLIQVPVSRLLLKGRVYESLPVSHLGFVPSMGCWGRAGLTLFLKSICQQLWSLTVIGGMIKACSCLLVPYIAAENPSIRPNEAVTLSRRMMNGHKWEFFVHDLSFLGWQLLSVLTLGLVGFFFSDPCCHAFRAEFYAGRRSQAKREGLPGSGALNDEWLFEKAGGEALSLACADLQGQMARQQADTPIALSGFRAFAAGFLGIWLGKTGDKIRCQEGLNREARIGAVKKRFLMSFTQAGTRLYSVWSLAMMFFIFCFAVCFEIRPHEGSGVSEDLCIGGWPATFFREDTLPLSAAEAGELRKNIADHDLLEAAGYDAGTKEKVERCQADGTVERLRRGQEGEGERSKGGQEKENGEAA